MNVWDNEKVKLHLKTATEMITQHQSQKNYFKNVPQRGVHF